MKHFFKHIPLVLRIPFLLLFVVLFGMTVNAVIDLSTPSAEAKIDIPPNTSEGKIGVNAYEIDSGLRARTFYLKGFCYMVVTGKDKLGLARINCNGM